MVHFTSYSSYTCTCTYTHDHNNKSRLYNYILHSYLSASQRLSTTSVPFTVISMCHNPCNEDYLVVCGLKDCQLLVLNSSGHVTKRTVLHPSVGNNGYIIKPLWIPGSKNSLVLVADSFVKIYDILIDSLSPKYYFLVLNGKIKDATVAVTEEVCTLIVIGPAILCGSHKPCCILVHYY